nr:hypothetical protein BgiMline_025541 [Biomphalaria glabrata]
MLTMQILCLLCYVILKNGLANANYFPGSSDYLSDISRGFQNTYLPGPQVATTSVFSIGTILHSLNLDNLLGQSSVSSLLPLLNGYDYHQRAQPYLPNRNDLQNGRDILSRSNIPSRPDLTWERHINQEDINHYVFRSTPAPVLPSQQMSFGDYLRKATYDWLKSYKMAYFREFFQNDTNSVTYSASHLPEKAAQSADSGNTTTVEASTNLTSSATTPVTTTEETTTTTPLTTTTEATTITAATTTPKTTTESTTTTTSTTTIILPQDHFNEIIRVGFLPDQPNLGTRWNQVMDQHQKFSH